MTGIGLALRSPRGFSVKSRSATRLSNHEVILTQEQPREMVRSIREATNLCGSCGNDLRAKARFCDVCGSPVAARSATGEHKQVTVLFVDVVGSMKLAAALDAERLQELMNELFNRAAVVVQRYQGTVDKFTGDGLMALFGAPTALEDHALRACISAQEIQSVTKELATEVLCIDGVAFQIRAGLNSGDVIVEPNWRGFIWNSAKRSTPAADSPKRIKWSTDRLSSSADRRGWQRFWLIHRPHSATYCCVGPNYVMR